MGIRIKKLKERQLYFIAVFSIAGLILTNQILIQKLLSDIKDDAHVINLSSKQEMLVQRITKLSALSVTNPEHLDLLKKENETWNRVHLGLQFGDEELELPENKSELIEGLFTSIDPVQKSIYNAVKEAESHTDLEVLLPMLYEKEELFIPLMDAAVLAFEQESEDRVLRLVFVEILLAAISLVVLWFEFKLIFQPIIRKLKNKEKKLKKLNDNKDQILATVAHDIRNPLNAVQGTLEILRSSLTNLNEQDEMMMRLSQESCRKAEVLIQELLDMSLMESEDFHLETELIHLEQYFASVISQFEPKAMEKGIELKLNINPNELAVNLDKDKFARVIENLLTNAIKFTNESGKIEMESYEMDKEVMIKVTDNGIGIPEQLKEYIFDKFSKARRLGTKGEATTGLGMSIVKAIVEKHNGKIWLESQEGKGTSFYIRLPKQD